MFLILMLLGLGQNWLWQAGSGQEKTMYKVKKVSYNGDMDSEKNFVYNPKGDLIYFINGADSVKYIHYPDSIIQLNLHPDKYWEYKTCYLLDADRRALNALTYDNQGQMVREENYTYDEAGRLSYFYHYYYVNNEVTQYHFRYEGDSLMKINTMLPDGSEGNSFEFRYHSKVSNNFRPTQLGSWWDASPPDLLGVPPKYMPRTIICQSPQGDTLSFLEYRYYSMVNPKQLGVVETDRLNSFSNEIRLFGE